MLGFLLLIAVATVLVTAVFTVIIVYDAAHPARHTGAYAAMHGLPFDPGDLGYEYGQWTAEFSDGAKASVWDVKLARAEKSGELSQNVTVVLLHGWDESRIDMLGRLKFCERFACRAILYDLRGHGEAQSAGRLGNGEDDDLLAVLEQLGAEERLLIIGQDVGANIAIAAAAKDSAAAEQIIGVTAIAPYEDAHARVRSRLQRRGFPARPMADIALAYFALTGRAPLVVRPQLISSITCPVLQLPAWDEDAILRWVVDVCGECRERSASRRG